MFGSLYEQLHYHAISYLSLANFEVLYEAGG